MESIYSINPLQYLEPRLIETAVSRDPAGLSKEFESIFLMQMAKQAFKHSFWGSSDRLEVKMYQDLFIENFVNELVEENFFGLRESIQKRLEKQEIQKKRITND